MVVQLVPGVELHADPAHHHRGPAGEPPRVLGPDQSRNLREVRIGVRGPVDLTHQVPRGAGAVQLGRRLREAALDPPGGGEGAQGLGELPDRVGHDQRVVGADLQNQVSAAPGRLESVDPEPRQLDQPRRLTIGPAELGEEPGPEADGDGEPGGDLGEGRLLVVQRRGRSGKPTGVVGDQTQHPARRLRRRSGAEDVRGHRGMNLGTGGHAGLVLPVERDQGWFRWLGGGVGCPPHHRAGHGGTRDPDSGRPADGEQPSTRQATGTSDVLGHGIVSRWHSDRRTRSRWPCRGRRQSLPPWFRRRTRARRRPCHRP